MTGEIDTSYPERIWARVEPDWHEGVTGENFVGGMFDAGYFREGVPYVRKDLYEAERQRAEKAEASEADAVAEYHSIRRELSDILLLRNALRTRAEKAEAAADAANRDLTDEMEYANYWRQRAETAEASDAESIAMYQQARRRAENTKAENLRLRDVACEAMSQLRWLNEKEQRGSTNTVLARLEHALHQNEGGE